MKNNRNFFIGLAFTTAAIVLLIVIGQLLFSQLINQYVWLLVVYMIVITSITFLLAFKGFKKNIYSFQNYYMIALAIRILVSGGIIFLYFSMNGKSDSLSFLLNFFLIYLIYTIFEVRFLIKMINQTDSTK